MPITALVDKMATVPKKQAVERDIHPRPAATVTEVERTMAKLMEDPKIRDRIIRLEAMKAHRKA